MERKFFKLSVLGLAFVAIGCGSSKTVRVGEPGQKGVIVRDKEAANDVGVKETAFQKEGEKIADGQ